MDSTADERRLRYSERNTRMTVDLDDTMLATVDELARVSGWSKSKVTRLALTILARATEMAKKDGDFVLFDQEGTEVHLPELEQWFSRVEQEAACVSASTSLEQGPGPGPSPSAQSPSSMTSPG